MAYPKPIRHTIRYKVGKKWIKVESSYSSKLAHTHAIHISNTEEMRVFLFYGQKKLATIPFKRSTSNSKRQI